MVWFKFAAFPNLRSFYFFAIILLPSLSNIGSKYSLTTKAAISGVIIDLVNFYEPKNFNYSIRDWLSRDCFILV